MRPIEGANRLLTNCEPSPNPSASRSLPHRTVEDVPLRVALRAEPVLDSHQVFPARIRRAAHAPHVPVCSSGVSRTRCFRSTCCEQVAVDHRPTLVSLHFKIDRDSRGGRGRRDLAQQRLERDGSPRGCFLPRVARASVITHAAGRSSRALRASMCARKRSAARQDRPSPLRQPPPRR